LVAKRSPHLAALMALQPDLVADAIAGFADRFVANQESRQQLERTELMNQLERERLGLDSERGALMLLEKQFQMMLADFEAGNPDSVLS
jgi:hypothetical protein